MAVDLQSGQQKIHMQNIPAIIGFIILGLVILYFIQKAKKRALVQPDAALPPSNKAQLEEHVDFYEKLTDEEKTVFEEKVNLFLANVRITGIKRK